MLEKGRAHRGDVVCFEEDDRSLELSIQRFEERALWSEHTHIALVLCLLTVPIVAARRFPRDLTPEALI